ncbi:cysteine desulfurase family protein [Natronospora cellulosivora (SeqCode)]
MKEVYLDNSATTRPLDEVVKATVEVLQENYGNPSSLHNKGLTAERVLKKAREKIAEKLKVSAQEIYFTSGGTESNNLAIKGIAYQYQNRGKHIISSEIEHASVLESFKALEKEGFEVSYLKVDKQGYISLEELENTIKNTTSLVSLIHVNNELGTIQDIKKIGKIIKNKNPLTYFHIDAVQSLGKILLEPAKNNIDLLTISSHKIHGPKGIGALYLKKGIEVKTQSHGGGQEKGIRNGTENVPGIAGLIPAIEALPDFSNNYPANEKLEKLKTYFLEKLKEVKKEVVINSPEKGAPHVLSLSFPGIKAEVLIHSLESKGIYVSTGSACHSRNAVKSHVLRAINLPEKLIDGTIRVSFSHFNTKEEIDYTINTLNEQLEMFF